MSKDRAKNKGDFEQAGEQSSEKTDMVVETAALQETSLPLGVAEAMQAVREAAIRAERAVAEATRFSQQEATDYSISENFESSESD